MKTSRLHGFTLVELLIVIALIAILAAITMRTAGFMQEKAARARAEAEIKAFEGALERYKADFGEYPLGTNEITTAAGTSKLLYDALSPTNGKVYMEFNKTQTNSFGAVIDPFGNAYGYRYPGAATNSGSNFFDLWSTANKANNTNAWIKNW